MTGSKNETFDHDKDYPKEKDNDGKFIDPMHDPDVNINGTVGILLAEEITSYFTQGKKLP